MKPCPHCQSNDIYQYKETIPASGPYGPDLLPKLASGWFSTARLLPVLCANCGYLRFFASKEARHNPATSPHWEKI